MNKDLAELVAAIARNKQTVNGRPLASDRVFPSVESQAAALRAAEVILNERDELADALAATLRAQHDAGLRSMSLGDPRSPDD